MLTSRVALWNVALGILMARHGTNAHAAERNLARLATVCDMGQGDFARFLVLLTDAQASMGHDEPPTETAPPPRP